MNADTLKQSILQWWANNPMTYAEDHGGTQFSAGGDLVHHAIGTPGFFKASDKQFLEWNRPLEQEGIPFAKIFPYERFRGKAVLEIGCGMGAMASFWARQGAKVTAVDLNPTSIEQTRRRFELLGLQGQIQTEDARNLSFRDGSFDYVYSWGVLHHSPTIENSIRELFRVLKPGGQFGVMLYNRHSLLYGYHIRYLEGLLHAESRFLSSLDLASRYTDGHREAGNPHTWPVTRKEIRKMFGAHAFQLETRLFGTELDSTLKYMLPGLYFIVPKFVKKSWARRFGWSWWISGDKR